MPHWETKGRLYRSGVGVMVLGFLGYTVAFGVPAWRRDGDTTVLSSGLWQYMCDGLHNCQTYSAVETDTLFQVSRVLACIALALCFIALCLIFLHNCTAYSKSLQSENAFISIFPVFCGLLAMSSCVVYLEQGISSIYWGAVLGFAASGCTIFGGICMGVGLHIDRLKAASTQQTSSTVQNQTAFNQDITTMAIPVNVIPSNGAQTNMPMVSMASNTNTDCTGSSDQQLATQVDQQARLNPSAPPPDPDFLYY
ncbi:uncharacterized protein LOC124266392 [Haliotis rubra]|uniref:uncharacterized protein LOC124266392 n=1 Tax=Haliotis rubra TaxID=36100 RepID=UPI001EE5F490|nr:uncharacterized protein LOC124266392 [Haliotis rubra]XP_046557157.1 uncharacterized protein LOC124266392 [Haliotis rubra]XP_046557158.1 uncharacterized protein LOC124266392 [Haliotis rubra]